MSQSKLVSIIMPLYNAQEFILDTIKSVQAQTYVDWELIIVNDKSTDKSADIVSKEIKKDIRIKLYNQEKNQGAAIARNKAIELAKGDFFAFLDSDDLWETTKLMDQVGFMVKNNISFSCTYYGKIDTSGNNVNHLVKVPKSMNYNKLLLHCPGNSTVMYDVKKLGKIYVPNIKKRNDYLMWLKVIKKAGTISCLEKELSFHRLRDDSISSNKVKLIKYHWKIYRYYEKLSLLRSCYILGFYIINNFKTKIEFIFSKRIRYS